MTDFTSLGKQLKVLVSECTANGVLLDRPKYKSFTDKKDKTRDEVAIKLCKLMLETTYFCIDTKMFIKDIYISKTDVANELSKLGIDTIRNTVATRIRTDLKKFEKDFGNKVIVNLFEASDSVEIENYLYTLNLLEYKDAVKCELDNFRKLFIPLGEDDGGSGVSEDELKEFLSVVRPYTDSYMKSIEVKLNRKTCFYVRRLLVNGALGDVETRHLEMVKKVLGI